MQLQSDKSHKLDEIKTQFRAREGYYRLMNSPDYSQASQRTLGLSTGTANSNSSTASHEKTSIKISLVEITNTSNSINNQADSSINQPQHDRSRLDQITSLTPQSNRTSLKRAPAGARDTKICFNIGKELCVYNYNGVRSGPDSGNPIYKRSYKSSSPTCHDFNHTTALNGSVQLLVGFSHGQVQLIDLNGSDDQESCREFNVDRLIDKTRVTCIKWLPNSTSLFLVSHASGQLYLYKDDLPCGPTAPTYQLYKQSEGVVVYSCKTKTTRNPIYRWSIGAQKPDTASAVSNLLGSSSSLYKSDSESCSINEFVFSPCAKYLACVSQDGFLRVYCYDTMELIGRARSYYGGLLCVCWSPDGKYLVTGGEDDLITVWSFVERRVVARGVGHKSWVSVVAFDSFYDGCDLKNTDVDNYDDDDEEDKEVDVDQALEDTNMSVDNDDDDSTIAFKSQAKMNNRLPHDKSDPQARSPSNRSTHLGLASPHKHQQADKITSYRFGSVGQDTQLCLWDLSDDLIQQPVARYRLSCVGTSTSAANLSYPQINSTTVHVPNTCSNHKITTNELSSLPNKSSDIPSRNSATTDGSNKKSESTTSVSGATITSNHNIHNKEHKDATNHKTISTTSSSGGGLLSSRGGTFTKTFSLVGKREKRHPSQKTLDKGQNCKSHNSNNLNGGDCNRLIDDPVQLLGSPICPRMNEVPVIEPSVCKKISFERLTSLIFCKGGFITSCQDGFVFSWARPSKP